MKLMTMLVAAAVVAIGQTGSQNYAGTWTAEFAGTTFVRLQLRSTGSSLAGEISLGNIEFDKKGIVNKAAPAPPWTTPIFDIKERDGSLAFASKDSSDVDHFVLKVVDGATAELLFLPTEADLEEMAEEGIPAPKPFLLKKQR